MAEEEKNAKGASSSAGTAKKLSTAEVLGVDRASLTVPRLAGLGILTAVPIVLQMLGSFIKFGPFSISLTLVPIVVGAALFGPLAGAWLGFVFSMVVLFTDAQAFLAVSVPGTVLTVLLKGAYRVELGAF